MVLEILTYDVLTKANELLSLDMLEVTLEKFKEDNKFIGEKNFSIIEGWLNKLGRTSLSDPEGFNLDPEPFKNNLVNINGLKVPNQEVVMIMSKEAHLKEREEIREEQGFL